MKNAQIKLVASFSLAAIAAIIGLVWAVSTATPAAAQGTPEQQQACTPDAMRLCSEFIPDVSRITACMARKRASLSPACRRVFSRAPSHPSRPSHRAKRRTHRHS
jgi:hypothetical protein